MPQAASAPRTRTMSRRAPSTKYSRPNTALKYMSMTAIASVCGCVRSNHLMSGMRQVWHRVPARERHRGAGGQLPARSIDVGAPVAPDGRVDAEVLELLAKAAHPRRRAAADGVAGGGVE